MKNRAIIITRLHYAADDPKFAGRIELYRTVTLPSLLAQTDDNFGIYVWCEPWHDEVVKALHPRIRVFHVDCEKRYKGTGLKRYFVDYTPWEKVIDLPKYALQIGLDSDDYLSEDAIAKIKQLTFGNGNIKERTAITIQPIKVDVATGKHYHMRRYLGRRVAPTFALYQPPIMRGGFMFAYQQGHMRLAAYCDKKIEIPEGFAFMSIHGNNESTRLNERGDEPL